MAKLLWVTQENSPDLGSQNPSKSSKAIKLQIKFDIFQLREHYAEVRSIFVGTS
jgi:hypothetical protein